MLSQDSSDSALWSLRDQSSSFLQHLGGLTQACSAYRYLIGPLPARAGRGEGARKCNTSKSEHQDIFHGLGWLGVEADAASSLFLGDAACLASAAFLKRAMTTGTGIKPLTSTSD